MSGAAAATGTVDESRALRADAQRNRTLILAAAAEVFAEQGADACTSEIARRAGVGTATLFRRFPTKDDLVFAILEERLSELLAAAREGLEAGDPGAGLREFIALAARTQSEDRCLCESIGEVARSDPRAAALHAELLGASGRLLRRAQAAGAVRGDLEPDDLPFLVAAAALPVLSMGADPALHRRYLGVLLDGLRPQGATALEPPAPDLSRMGIAASG